MEPGSWVTIGQYSWLQEADFHSALLRAESIEFVIEDRHTLGWNPHFSVAFGGIDLKVRREDAERATQLLETYDLPSPQAPPES